MEYWTYQIYSRSKKRFLQSKMDSSLLGRLSGETNFTKAKAKEKMLDQAA
jgi:hypothetical protein